MISRKILSVIAFCVVFTCSACDRFSPFDYATRHYIDPDAKIFTSFGIMGFTGTIDNTANTILVTMPEGTDLRSLTPVFTMLGDHAEVAGEPLTSGVTVIDFSSAVTVTVYALNGTNRNYTVTVEATAPVIDHIAITPDAPEIGIGENIQLSAIAYFADSGTMNVTAYAAWTSDDESVATVDGGLVTSYTEGVAPITAEYLGFTAAASVTVSATAPVLDHIEISTASVSLIAGDTLQLAATAYYSDASSIDITNTGTWESLDPATASVNEGLITANAAGTTTITVSYGGLSDSVVVDVAARLEYIYISPDPPWDLEVNDTTQLYAYAHYSDLSEVDITSVATWGSSDLTYATVSAGLVNGVAEGSANISAEYNGSAYGVVINVVPRTTFCVATGGSDTTGVGSPARPFGTIQYAIDTAAMTGTDAFVRVAGGTYPESITMYDMVRVLGSYNDSFTAMDINSWPSSIKPPVDTVAVNCVSPMGNTAILVGFWIIPAAGVGQVGVYIADLSANPVIVGNIIDGGSNTTSYARGISVEGGNPLIEKNIIRCSSGSIYPAYGIYVSSSAYIRNNCIDVGAGNSTYGIYLSDAGVTTIRNNTINAGSGTFSIFGIYLNNSPSAIIQNNILFKIKSPPATNEYGIFETSASTNPTSVENNDIVSTSLNVEYNFTYVYYDYGQVTQDIVSAIDLNTSFDSSTRANNVTVDPLLADIPGDNWHFTTSLPSVVTGGGLVIGDYNDDFEYTVRSIPWSMGAYEY